MNLHKKIEIKQNILTSCFVALSSSSLCLNWFSSLSEKTLYINGKAAEYVSNRHYIANITKYSYFCWASSLASLAEANSANKSSARARSQSLKTKQK